jgi:ABC-type sugar transport system ATPase subunit
MTVTDQSSSAAAVGSPGEPAPHLVLRGLKKRFPGTLAVNLDEAPLGFHAGEIHGVVGENGAGKSTLFKLIAGISPPSAGVMQLGGRPYAPHDAAAARRLGVDIVVQEPGLVDTMSVEDNLVLGREGTYAPHVIFNPRRRTALAAAALSHVPVAASLGALAGRLTLEDQKLVELARALSQKPSILLIDEITASLSHRSIPQVFELLRGFAAQGGLVLYISHHLREIFELCHRVTVMRDGAVVSTFLTSDTSEAQLTSLMVGRVIAKPSTRAGVARGEGVSLLEVENLAVEGRFSDVTFNLRPGEIVGIGGLVDCGSETLALALFGAVRPTRGRMKLGGLPLSPGHPRAAIRQNIGFVPSDRDREGLILGLSIERNIGLPALARAPHHGLVRPANERRTAAALLERLDIRSRGAADLPLTLSGGNRQKVVLAKWLASDIRLLILHNPTRGVDVGGKEEIYRIIHDLCDAGVGIVLVSDDLPELIRLSDSLLIMRGGSVSYRTTRESEPSEHELIGYMV